MIKPITNNTTNPIYKGINANLSSNLSPIKVPALEEKYNPKADTFVKQKKA
ncbi:hypothetical protein IKA92_07095 [bacterium]|nr:hypothetical protein [bacterium]